jgi:hypothetical protein
LLVQNKYTFLWRESKLVENPSELAAGTRGSSLGIEALKVAAFNAKSDFFKKHHATKVENYNYLLFSDTKTPKAKRIDGVYKVFVDVAEKVCAATLGGNKFPLGYCWRSFQCGWYNCRYKNSITLMHVWE